MTHTSSNTVNATAGEVTKPQSKPAASISSILFSPSVIVGYLIFLGFLYYEMPYLYSSQPGWKALITGLIFFPTTGYALKFISPLIAPYNKLPVNKQSEWNNRIISFILDASCCTPSLMAYYSIPPVITLANVIAGRSWEMDVAAGWITAYDIYDVIVAIPIYGKAAFTIILHHALQLFVFYSYFADPHGVVFMIAGGVMLFSSGVLHIQRLLTFSGINSKSLFFRAINYFMVLAWIHTRFIAYFYLIYYFANPFTVRPLTFNHLANSVIAILFSGMNFMWLKKMVLMKDISF